jgi:hypothetical protein
LSWLLYFIHLFIRIILRTLNNFETSLLNSFPAFQQFQYL